MEAPQVMGQNMSHREATEVADLKKGARITGATRAKLSADLRKKYDAGKSM